MYTQHKAQEPSFSSFLHAPYSVVATQVKLVDGTGYEHMLRDVQKEAVLALHAKRSSILKFQKAVIQLQQECDKWKQGGFDVSMNISLPIKKTIYLIGYRFSLSVQEDQQVNDSEIEYGDGLMWFHRSTFYTITRENKSTATLIVIEKLVK
jgi:hypothetical protein